MPSSTTALDEAFWMETVTANAGPATSPGPTACDCTGETFTIDALTWPPSAALRPSAMAACVVTAIAGTVFDTSPPPGAGTCVVRAGLADVGAAVVGRTAEFTGDEATTDAEAADDAAAVPADDGLVLDCPAAALVAELPAEGADDTEDADDTEEADDVQPVSVTAAQAAKVAAAYRTRLREDGLIDDVRRPAACRFALCRYPRSVLRMMGHYS